MNKSLATWAIGGVLGVSLLGGAAFAVADHNSAKPAMTSPATTVGAQAFSVTSTLSAHSPAVTPSVTPANPTPAKPPVNSSVKSAPRPTRRPRSRRR